MLDPTYFENAHKWWRLIYVCNCRAGVAIRHGNLLEALPYMHLQDLLAPGQAKLLWKEYFRKAGISGHE